MTLILSTCMLYSSANVQERIPALLQAIQHDDIATVRQLLTPDLPVEARDGEGMTLLHWACGYGNLQIVQVMVEHGYLVNARDYSNKTPLHAAAWMGHNNVTLYLLSQGADMRVQDTEQGFTPLHSALWNGQFATAALLATHDPCLTELMPSIMRLIAARMQDDTLSAATKKQYTSITAYLRKFAG